MVYFPLPNQFIAVGKYTSRRPIQEIFTVGIFYEIDCARENEE